MHVAEEKTKPCYGEALEQEMEYELEDETVQTAEQERA